MGRVLLVLGALLGGLKPLVAATATAASAVLSEPAPAAPAKKNELSVAAIAAQRGLLQKEIAATREELAKLPEGSSNDAARWLTQETALLERIDAIHAEQERTWQHAADLATEAAEVEERTRNRRPPEATFKPPHDLASLDQIYGERDYLDQATEALKRDVDHFCRQIRARIGCQTGTNQAAPFSRDESFSPR